MADQAAFQERFNELFSEHEEFEDTSLRYSFFMFLDEFEGGLEPVLSGQLSAEQLQMMGIDSDVKMSEEGLAVLREAAANEPDEMTTGLRESERIGDKICAELANLEPVSLRIGVRPLFR